MRDSSSRCRWKRPEGTLLLVALLAWGLPLPCLAGESYLDRSKVREAVPYGTTIEPPPSPQGTKPAAEPDDGTRHTAPASSVTSSTIDPESTQGGRGGGAHQPR